MNSLKSKIFIFFMALLLLVMALIFGLVYRATYEHTVHQIQAQLLSGYKVFNNDLQSRHQFQSSTAELITQDFGLRSEVASFSEGGDVESLRVALNNFRVRSDAQLAMAMAVDGHILAEAQHGFSSGTKLSFQYLLNATDGTNDALVLINDNIFHVFATPIYAPKPNLIGWLVLGFSIDDQSALRLSKLTNLDVSFIRRDGDRLHILASSLGDDSRSALARLGDLPVNGHSINRLLGHDHIFYGRQLSSAGGTVLEVILQQSLTDALRDYVALQWQLLAILGLALLMSAVGAFLIASSISKPLLEMVSYVRNIGAGNYGAKLPDKTAGEIDVLIHEFMAMQQAIADREKAIAHAAFHDTLTNLPNRLNFQKILQIKINEYGSEKCLAVLVMGLNHFKDINDTLGHFSGDQLLRQLTLRLQALLRPNDALARLGGDSFGILLADVDRADLIPLILYYRGVFVEALNIESIVLTVNASMGIAIYPEHGESPEILLQRAEIAMYVSKEKKITYALYSGHQNRYSLLRLSLMSELKDAIGRGELILYYQPKLSIATQTVVGVECLVRWEHPVHGFISPDDFIPLAEQTGNIRYLTDWVLNAALKQHRLWRDGGLFLNMAINISVVDLQDESLIDRIDKALERENIDSSALTLEVTESGVMSDVNKAVELLLNIKSRGLRLSIDDYGTGYSSMAQLKRLPVNELKIDKSFILDVTKNVDDAIIVRSTIELGHNMGMKLVAEGVETVEVLDLLRQYGCDYVQGYYLSRPVPAADLVLWLAKSSFKPEDITGSDFQL